MLDDIFGPAKHTRWAGKGLIEIDSTHLGFGHDAFASPVSGRPANREFQ